jgi:hypothetical protein
MNGHGAAGMTIVLLLLNKAMKRRRAVSNERRNRETTWRDVAWITAG